MPLNRTTEEEKMAIYWIFLSLLKTEKKEDNLFKSEDVIFKK